MSRPTADHKKLESEEIARQTEEFLRNGGEIEEIPPGHGSYQEKPRRQINEETKRVGE